MATITTQVLENGQWVSRTRDLREILQQDQDNLKPTPEPKDILPPTPQLGLLSRTIIRSPLINRLLPARLRHGCHNDVAFVGEDFLHVKEILSNRTIRHVSTKVGFGTRIRASAIIGRAPEPPDDSKQNSSRQSSMDFDLEEPYSERMDIDINTYRLPPQMLVLALEDRRLMFLYLRHSQNGPPKFRQMSIPLPTTGDSLKLLGRHIAVDPQSQVMAVGASEGGILLCRLKQMQDLRDSPGRDVRSWCPISKQLSLKVKGSILKMDFLYPDYKQDRCAILVIVVAKGGCLLVLSYYFDLANGALNNPQPCDVQRIDKRKQPIFGTSEHVH
jgi:hypothetical protein